MAVLWTDLLSPAGGELETDLFPKDSSAQLQTRLTAYITDAASNGATTDAGTKKWAYYRAYRAVWTRLSADPSKAAIENEESVGWVKEQIDNFKTLMDAALDDFNDEIADEDPDDADWSVLTSLRHT